MDNKELLRYAIKGIGAEIAEIESKIERGAKVIDEINRGVRTSKKSREEILNAIQEYQYQRDELRAKRDNLLFDEMMVDEDRKTRTREENVIKVALSSILSKDTENLGNLFIEEMTEILDKIAMRPYCERIGKRYDVLTNEDKKIIAAMQLNDYISAGEKRAAEIEKDLLNGEC